MGIIKKVAEALKDERRECGVWNRHTGNTCSKKRAVGQVTCGNPICEHYHAVKMGWL